MLIKKGNLIKKALDGEFDIILYPCNCFFTPVSNTAKEIRETFTFAKYVDKRTKEGDKNKMGGFSKCIVDLREFNFKINKKLIVINAYIYFSNEDPQFEYKYLESIFKFIKKKYTGKKLGFPLLGYGLKNVSINKICNIIDRELEGEEYYLVIDSN